MEQSRDFTVSVLTGTHAGARLSLSPGLYRIGCDPAADILLDDPEVAPFHVTLELTEEGAVLDDRAPGLLIGSRPCVGSDPFQAALPFELAMGDVQLRVEGPPPLAADMAADAVPSVPGMRTFGVRGRAFGVALCCAIGLAVILYEIGGNGMAIAGAFGVRPAPAVAASNAMPAPEATAATELQHLLDAKDLHMLSVESAPGTIIVRGALSDAQRPAWQAIERTFDAKYGGHILLRAELGADRIARPAIEVQAVWAGPSPYVIDPDGNRLGEGAVTPDGWQIVQILPDRVILRRGAQSVALTL